MLFNSAAYLFAFLPVTLLLFVYLARRGSTEAQISWLIIASLFFYGSWKPLYIVLIFASVVVNFLVGRKIATRLGTAQKFWLIAGVCFNLALLGYFKYAGFLVDNLNAMGNWLIPLPEITLPLAISFFTFQQIAYLVDVARGDCKEYQFRHYSLFVLFFPQLIAGPIVHHSEMMPQFDRPRPPANLPSDLAVGLTIISIGLFKKVVMADSLAGFSDPIFAAAAAGKPVGFIDSWVATLAFSFQIYFDFSGYSDMAIGSARLFGIKLPENFRSPYKSDSIIEIWRRWHITLSRFLRDYLYIALGGNRLGRFNRYRNLFITMLLGGLWHGAAWTYVIWGGLHGLFLCINYGWRAMLKLVDPHAKMTMPWLRPLAILLTFLAWSLALTVFRAPDIQTANTIITAGFTEGFTQAPLLLRTVLQESSLAQLLALSGVEANSYVVVYLLLLLSGVICWALPNTQQFMRDFKPVVAAVDTGERQSRFLVWRPQPLLAVVTAFLLSVSLLNLSSVTEFIYFQF